MLIELIKHIIDELNTPTKEEIEYEMYIMD